MQRGRFEGWWSGAILAVSGALASGCGSVVEASTGGAGGTGGVTASNTGGDTTVTPTGTGGAGGGTGSGGGTFSCDSPPVAVGEVLAVGQFGDAEDQYLGPIALAEDGGLFLGGAFSGTFALTSETALIGEDALDAMVARLTPDLSVVWARSFSGPGNQSVSRVAPVPGGGLFVSGSFDGSMDLGGGFVVDPKPGRNVYVARLDESGATAAVIPINATGDNLGVAGIAPAPDGGVLAVGYFSGLLEIDGSPIDQAASLGAFVTRIDPAGQVVYVAPLTGPEQVAWSDIVPVNGGFAVGGTFQGALGLGTNLQADTSDGLVVTISLDGQIQSAHAITGEGTEIVQRLAVSPSGRLYVGGARFGVPGPIDLGLGPIAPKGPVDVFVMSMIPGGDVQWGELFGDPNGAVSILALSSTCADEVLIAGQADGVAIGADPPPPDGGYHAFAAKLDPSGTPLWSRSFGGFPTSSAEGIVPIDVDRIYLSGFFTGTLTAATSPIESAGANDALLLHLSP